MTTVTALQGTKVTKIPVRNLSLAVSSIRQERQAGTLQPKPKSKGIQALP